MPLQQVKMELHPIHDQNNKLKQSKQNIFCPCATMTSHLFASSSLMVKKFHYQYLEKAIFKDCMQILPGCVE